jgi:predicted permease
MTTFLKALFGAILVAMLVVTVAASLERNVWDAARDLWPDAWFRATLADAYFGFLTVYVWIAYRETSFAARALWLVLLLGLGNIAISAYVLIQLRRLRPGEPVASILTRRPA